MDAVATSRLRLLQGDAATVLRTLPPASVHCVITSPPYFGQRSYGAGPDELGGEGTAERYLFRLQQALDGVAHVLRDDGTLWLNLADKFTDQQLLGLPFRLVQHLQLSGWYWRQTIIWDKPNAPPEDVSNRPTTGHEYVFLLTRRPTGYYYDALAAAVPNKGERGIDPDKLRGTETPRFALEHRVKNRRTIWHTYVGTGHAPGHPAPFPSDLVTPMILLGTSNAGVCPRCGAPYQRTLIRYGLGGNVRRAALADGRNPSEPQAAIRRSENRYSPRGDKRLDAEFHRLRPDEDRGFQPSCTCTAGDPIPALVLDPFCGAGSAGVAALSLGRDFVGIDLAQPFLDTAAKRLEALWTTVGS